MAPHATTRRRWCGALALLVALAMLICGQTALKTQLQGIAFMLYWLVCFAFTGLAVLIALLDAHVVRLQTRQEQRQLFENTLKRIET